MYTSLLVLYQRDGAYPVTGASADACDNSGTYNIHSLCNLGSTMLEASDKLGDIVKLSPLGSAYFMSVCSEAVFSFKVSSPGFSIACKLNQVRNSP